MKRYTLLLNAGSSTVGELHFESPRTGYMYNLGPAGLTRDGLCWRGVGYWLMPEQFRVQARTGQSLTDRVIADVLARIPAAMARAKQLTAPRDNHDAQVAS